MRLVIWLLVATLLILHQDFWNWNNAEMYFGFMPSGLLYHIGISVAAAAVWWFACTFAWPAGIDEFEDEPMEKGGEA